MNTQVSALPRRLFRVLASAFALYYLYCGVFGSSRVEMTRGLFVGGSVVLALLSYLKNEEQGGNRLSRLFDLFLAVVATLCFAYFIINYPQSILRAGLPPLFGDVVVSMIVTLLLLETSRRTMGPVLPILTVVFIVYSVWGPYFPMALRHRGTGLQRFVAEYFMSLDGIFGSVTHTVASFVFPFVMFSTMFIEYGGIDLFLQAAKKVVGRSPGGPAKMAVVASFLMGMISGSQVGNVVGTGSFTIPTMKKSGIPGHLAGAVEAAASLGGSMMPPIMGATAFLISEFTGYSYLKIIRAAAIPGALYFYTVYLMVHFMALKLNLKGQDSIDGDDAPTSSVLRRGWYYPIPVGIVVLSLNQP